MKILKFGGSSVGSPERIRQVMGIIKKAYDENSQIGVVVSAFGGSTDQLIAIGRLAASGSRYQDELGAFFARHEGIVRELIPEGLCLEKEFGELKGLLQEVRELSPRLLDQLMSFGERLSARIISGAIRPLIPEARFVDAREWVSRVLVKSGAFRVIPGTGLLIHRHFRERIIDLDLTLRAIHIPFPGKGILLSLDSLS